MSTGKHLDKNFDINTDIGESDVKFYDVREEPFRVYGLYNYKNEDQFKRLPDDIAEKSGPSVAALSKNTAGGRVRFATDSKYVAISAKMKNITRTSQHSLLFTAGFDFYLDDPITGKSRYLSAFMPPYDMEDGYTSKRKFESREMRYFTINFPSYSDVTDLYIGIQEDAKLESGMPYRDAAPIVYYGSSITQGSTASRSGNTYENMICQKLNVDYINLGFSGHARAQEGVLEYLSKLDMSLFVCDYDHNSPTLDFLKETHAKVYHAVRDTHPTTPIILVSRPDMDGDNFNLNVKRRDVVHETFLAARAAGDQHVYFLDGGDMFKFDYECNCSVDTVHPNDIGFTRMAESISAAIVRAFTERTL